MGRCINLERHRRSRQPTSSWAPFPICPRPLRLYACFVGPALSSSSIPLFASDFRFAAWIALSSLSHHLPLPSILRHCHPLPLYSNPSFFILALPREQAFARPFSSLKSGFYQSTSHVKCRILSPFLIDPIGKLWFFRLGLFVQSRTSPLHTPYGFS